MNKKFIQKLIAASLDILSLHLRGTAETVSNSHFLSVKIFVCCLLMLLPTTQSVAAKPSSRQAISKPSLQAIELARRARSEGRTGNDARATHLWNRARTYDPSIPPAPQDWSFERTAQRFSHSLQDRSPTRNELLILIAMLPYQMAQKQLNDFLARFPHDKELRELSLAMAELHQDKRLHRLQDSALSSRTLNNYTWLYGLRLAMLLGYVFLIRLILKLGFRKPLAVEHAHGLLEKSTGEQA